jgi:hypothetical protein
MVELNEGRGEDDAAPKTSPPPAPPSSPLQGEPPPATESAAEGVARAGRILAAARHARWPMYLRNMKQILRQYRGDGSEGQPDAGGAVGAGSPGSFDERRYGFGGLMDLVKALQRDGYVRLERDRRGGLRVCAGPNLDKTTPADVRPEEALEGTLGGSQPRAPVDASAPAGTGQPEPEPVPRDTTAELLGRAKPKRARTRSAGGGTGSARRMAPAPSRKTPARRSTRARRPAPEATEQSED